MSSSEQLWAGWAGWAKALAGSTVEHPQPFADAEAIKKIAKVYKNDFNLSFRRAAAIYDIAFNLIRNYLNS